MTKNGKQLEGLVEYVEKTLWSQGFKVKTNEHIFDDDGNQIAEFDIEIRGRLRTTEFSWLIECRDRPSTGAAPGSWIEQLSGRKNRFNFDRVTAVSTTGFSPSAKSCAKSLGIELRQVTNLEPESFSDWMVMQHMEMVVRMHNLKHARLMISPDEPEEIQAALLELTKKGSGGKILKSISTNETTSTDQVFMNAIQKLPHLFEDLLPNEDARPIKLRINYPDDDYYIVETSAGNVRIIEILLSGEISIKINYIPMEAKEYRNLDSDEIISQVASFPFNVRNNQVSFEMHRIPESGHTHVLLRTLGSIKETA